MPDGARINLHMNCSRTRIVISGPRTTFDHIFIRLQQLSCSKLYMIDPYNRRYSDVGTSTRDCDVRSGRGVWRTVARCTSGSKQGDPDTDIASVLYLL
jgi:hypothetical protein